MHEYKIYFIPVQFGILFKYSGACPPPPAGTSTATPPPTGTSTATPPSYTTNYGPFTSQTPDEGQKKPNIGLIVGL